jgi:hypothetical protein
MQFLFSSSMYRLKFCNRIKLVCFLKFDLHEMNSEMVKSGMVVLTRREKVDMADTDVVVGWMLQPAVGTVVDKREKANVTWERVRYSHATTGTSLMRYRCMPIVKYILMVLSTHQLPMPSWEYVPLVVNIAIGFF